MGSAEDESDHVRDDGTTRRRPAAGGGVGTLVSLLCFVAVSRPLRAQLSLQPSLGLRYTSAMVRDAIVTPLTVRPALAPTLAVTVTTPLQRGWGGQATLDVATSMLERHDADGTTTDLGRLSTLAFTVGVRRGVAAGLFVAAGAGGLKYFPARESGIFREGSSLAGLGMVTVEYAPAAVARYGLAVQARYDVHRFITPALRSEGFDSPRTVHRVALAARIAWQAAR